MRLIETFTRTNSQNLIAILSKEGDWRDPRLSDYLDHSVNLSGFLLFFFTVYSKFISEDCLFL